MYHGVFDQSDFPVISNVIVFGFYRIVLFAGYDRTCIIDII